MKFRKKPVVIDAVQWNGSNIDEIFTFVSEVNVNIIECWDSQTGEIVLNTLEGPHVAKTNDWIIRGVKNEYYPCKPDIFEMTYEQAVQA